MGIVLFLRPRRFGKSLFMSMLDNFFDIDKKEDNKNLFEGLYISKSELSKYPTIFLNFKDLKQESYEETLKALQNKISSLYRQKAYVKDFLDDKEKAIFNLIVSRESNLFDLKDSIRFLSECLEKYHNEKIIVLIDEYDAAINESYVKGCYDELMDLM